MARMRRRTQIPRGVFQRTILTWYLRSVGSISMNVSPTLLGLLERQSSYGYDLKMDYDAYFGVGKGPPLRPGLRHDCLPGP